MDECVDGATRDASPRACARKTDATNYFAPDVRTRARTRCGDDAGGARDRRCDDVVGVGVGGSVCEWDGGTRATGVRFARSFFFPRRARA